MSKDNSYTIEHQYDLFESLEQELPETIGINDKPEDVYIEILKIVKNKKKADLLKKLFDKHTDDMLKLIMKIAKGE